ncbi:MAG: hypothetical protein V1790_02560 [Planctomycetota bacterium]
MLSSDIRQDPTARRKKNTKTRSGGFEKTQEVQALPSGVDLVGFLALENYARWKRSTGLEPSEPSRVPAGVARELDRGNVWRARKLDLPSGSTGVFDYEDYSDRNIPSYELPPARDRFVRGKIPKRARPSTGFVGQNLTLTEYIALTQQQKLDLQLDVLEANREWIQQTFQQTGAAWFMVVDGEVVGSSTDIDEYPQEAAVLQICQRRGKFPFIFTDDRRLLVEENSSPWSRTENPGDTYPTVKIAIRSDDSALSWTADFDTGAGIDFFDLGRLESCALIEILSTDVPQRGRHLDMEYWYFWKLLLIGLVPAAGPARYPPSPVNVRCVLKWDESPWVKINPDRSALMGRRLFHMLQPAVILRFATQTTDIIF